MLEAIRASVSELVADHQGAHMTEQSPARVAVYLDFDNIVISRYNQLHGRNQFSRDKVRDHLVANPESDPEITKRMRLATVDIGAILDYASSFGSIVISRAYADWSAAVNAGYQKQLIGRAVDLTQLFPTVTSLKNGADIRLAVDVVEDIFRLDELTHVVIVAGDSDYIPLAQRCKRLGRYVVGIGVAGATSTSLAAACDEFADYDDLPGVTDAATILAKAEVAASRHPAKVETDADTATAAGAKAQKAATDLLVRALTLLDKNDREWQFAAEVKPQMQRMDPTFQERALGFSQFYDFVKSRNDVVELDDQSPSGARRLRLRKSR
ncbi:NYN domain-containing protein [Leifsonia sp. A12D58]|uniref:NYN domain-containing protein n=1 Tax=Leifsonia sp. A12D58 TaxID=3397674 RepID=UPI0039E151CC